MRYREFRPKKDNEVDEIAPALALGARAVGGALATGARAAGSALATGARAVGSAALQGAKTVGGAIANTAGQAVSGIAQGAGQAIGNAVAGQSQQTQAPVKLTPGMKIALPKPVGDIKVKSIQGKNAVLDTQKTPLGMDITVDQDQLLATLGQSSQQGTAGKIAQGVKAVGGMVKQGFAK
jgi:hypothetical protein